MLSCISNGLPAETMESLLITPASSAQKRQFETKAFLVEHDVTA
jgi:hypothetical protein